MLMRLYCRADYGLRWGKRVWGRRFDERRMVCGQLVCIIGHLSGSGRILLVVLNSETLFQPIPLSCSFLLERDEKVKVKRLLSVNPSHQSSRRPPTNRKMHQNVLKASSESRAPNYAQTLLTHGVGRRRQTILAEKHIPFQHVPVDLAQKEHKTAEFLELHPFGQVPVIVRGLSRGLNSLITLSQDDDGFVLYESRAICRYLAEKYADQGTPLLPEGLKERGMVEQAASIEFANFLPAILKVMTENHEFHLALASYADQL